MASFTSISSIDVPYFHVFSHCPKFPNGDFPVPKHSWPGACCMHIAQLGRRLSQLQLIGLQRQRRAACSLTWVPKISWQKGCHLMNRSCECRQHEFHLLSPKHPKTELRFNDDGTSPKKIGDCQNMLKTIVSGRLSIKPAHQNTATPFLTWMPLGWGEALTLCAGGEDCPEALKAKRRPWRPWSLVMSMWSQFFTGHFVSWLNWHIYDVFIQNDEDDGLYMFVQNVHPQKSLCHIIHQILRVIFRIFSHIYHIHLGWGKSYIYIDIDTYIQNYNELYRIIYCRYFSNICIYIYV